MCTSIRKDGARGRGHSGGLLGYLFVGTQRVKLGSRQCEPHHSWCSMLSLVSQKDSVAKGISTSRSEHSMHQAPGALGVALCGAGGAGGGALETSLWPKRPGR